MTNLFTADRSISPAELPVNKGKGTHHLKEIKPVSPKGNQPWKTDAEAEAPILWPPDAKSQLIGKDPDARKDWRPEQKGTTEDEMVGGITNSMDMGLSKLREMVKDKEVWHAAVHEVAKTWTQLSDRPVNNIPAHKEEYLVYC